MSLYNSLVSGPSTPVNYDSSTIHPYLDSELPHESSSDLNTSDLLESGYLSGSAQSMDEPKKDFFMEWDSLAEKHLVSDAQTYMAYFKAFVGSGVLFLPSAFGAGGLAATVFSFVLSTWLGTVCMLKLVECKQRLVEDFKNGINHGIENTHQIVGFGLLGQASFGDYGRWIVDVSIAVAQSAGASAYLAFVSKNLYSVITELNNCVQLLTPTTLIWISVIVLIPFMYIRQLQRFKYQIMIADAIIVSGLLFLYVKNSIMIHDHGIGPGIIQFDKIGYWSSLGTAFYALEGTAFVLPIEHAMRNKQNFAQVTVWSGVGIGILYMSFGMVGYLAFGKDVQGLIMINLKNLDPSSVQITILQIAYCLALILSYPVVMYPAVRIIEAHIYPHFLPKSTELTWKKNTVRTLLVILCGGLATIGGTSFDNFVSLTGGLMCIPLTLLYPAYFHLKICGDRMSKFTKNFNIFIIILGIIMSLLCIGVSIYTWETSVKPSTCSIN